MINWKMIDTVLLDMDGTLLDLNFDNHFWKEFVPLKYAQLHNMNLIEAKRILEPRFKSMEGQLEWYCLDYWSNELQLNMAGLKQEIAELIKIMPHVIEFLESARKAGKRLLLVTNAHRDSLNLKMEKTCLHGFFDDIISSHDFGFAKEHAEFWTILEQKHGLNKASTLLVDDSLAVLNAAENYGLAYVVAVSQPDSTQGKKHTAHFLAINDFQDLLQGLTD